MAKVIIERLGVSVARWKVGFDDLSWRDAMYESAMRSGVRLVGPVVLDVWPLCVDGRGRVDPLSCFGIIDVSIEAAIASKVLDKRRDITEAHFHGFEVCGVDGIRLELSDANEPF